MVYNTQFQIVSGGYKGNDAVANHIWDSLGKNECENALVEAERQQEPLHTIHPEWLTPVEQTVRAEREMNNEIMRRVQRRDQASDGPVTTLTEHSANHDISVVHAMRNRTETTNNDRTDTPDYGSEKDEEDDHVPVLQTHNSRRVH